MTVEQASEEKKSRKEYIAEWRAKHPGIQRVYYFKKHFGLLPADIDRMLSEQSNQCNSCHEPFNSTRKFYPFQATDQTPVLLCLSCKTKAVKAPKPI